MLKETGYQEKFEMLAGWFQEIVDTVKKDLKNEHLKVDRPFCKKYFQGKNLNQITSQEMAVAYQRDIKDGNVGLGEFIATRWLLRHTDIYGYFEEAIKNFTKDFETLDVLPQDLSEQLITTSTQRYGAKNTYLFSVLNSVVFPHSLYATLRETAEKESCDQKEKEEKEAYEESREALIHKYQRENLALVDRYEKKFSGLQKKYLNDVEALKKQIATLHKKLAEKNIVD